MLGETFQLRASGPTVRGEERIVIASTFMAFFRDENWSSDQAVRQLLTKFLIRVFENYLGQPRVASNVPYHQLTWKCTIG